jgi:hypothetical protein
MPADPLLTHCTHPWFPCYAIVICSHGTGSHAGQGSRHYCENPGEPAWGTSVQIASRNRPPRHWCLRLTLPTEPPPPGGRQVTRGDGLHGLMKCFALIESVGICASAQSAICNYSNFMDGGPLETTIPSTIPVCSSVGDRIRYAEVTLRLGAAMPKLAMAGFNGA